jgi:hypothetical protein
MTTTIFWISSIPSTIPEPRKCKIRKEVKKQEEKTKDPNKTDEGEATRANFDSNFEKFASIKNRTIHNYS